MEENGSKKKKKNRGIDRGSIYKIINYHYCYILKFELLL